MFIFFQNNDTSTFTHDKAITILVVRPGCFCGIVIEMSTECLCLCKASNTNFTDGGLCATSHHHICVIKRHHPRGIALPFAVSSDANAVREFKISGKADSPSPLASPAPATLTQVREFKISGKTDGCASLLSAVSSYYSNDCTNTSGVLERRAVPSVSLEVILGTWLRGRDVSVAKVDAQGLDVGVVRSGGRYLSQLKAVQLEVVRDRPPLKCEPQYAAEPGRTSEAKCGVLVRAMDELGDEPDGTN